MIKTCTGSQEVQQLRQTEATFQLDSTSSFSQSAKLQHKQYSAVRDQFLIFCCLGYPQSLLTQAELKKR